VLGDAVMGLRFRGQLPRFLHHPVTAAEARAAVAARLGRREADFLEHAHRAVYERPDSPYRALLRHAGVERGDLEALVRRDGLEGALLIHPRVGAVDPETAVRVFLDAVGAGRPGRVPSLAWADGGLLHVERRPPVSTETGKIQHLHARTGRARGARAAP
jgi:hypothetical protein